MKQLDAFLDVPPPPPSGPQRDVERFCGTSYEGYVWWKTSTVEGRRAFGYIEQCALVAAEKGQARISVNRLVEEVRVHLQLEVNNTYRAWIADDLVMRHPHLTDLIERRRRRKAA